MNESPHGQLSWVTNMSWGPNVPDRWGAKKKPALETQAHRGRINTVINAVENCTQRKQASLELAGKIFKSNTN